MIQATRNRSAGGLPCEVEYYGVSQRGLPEGRQTHSIAGSMAHWIGRKFYSRRGAHYVRVCALVLSSRWDLP